MSRTFEYLFYPKKPKKYISGPVPLYLRITVDGKRSETATALNILPEKWETGKMKGSKEDAKTFNAYLDTLVNQLYNCHKVLLENELHITAETLRNAFVGKSARPRMLVEIFKAYIGDIEKLIGIDYKRSTYEKYEDSLNHLANFLMWKYKIADINLHSLAYQFITDYDFYLKAEKKIGVNARVKLIQHVKKIVKECIKKKWLKEDPFAEFYLKTVKTNPTFLFDFELDAIEKKHITIERLSRVRDLFIFSCYTGLAFVDAFNLTPNDITIGIDGEKWIIKPRQKTNVQSHIPLLPPVLNIISKYKDYPAVINKGKLIPMLSNQRINGYLKEIADICGITKNLTHHVARHTFATTVTLTNNVPIESVGKMLGQSDLRSTQHYAQVLDRKVSNDMSALRKKLTPQLEIVKEDKAISG